MKKVNHISLATPRDQVARRATAQRRAIRLKRSTKNYTPSMLRYPPYEIQNYSRTTYDEGIIYNADCLDAIKTLPDDSVDCIITDPPYFLGMTHNGQKGNFRDLSICRPFYRELFQEYRRVCKPEACIYFFCDWRGYAFYYPLFDGILGAHNMLVWNKLSGPGNHYAFIHELVLFHAGAGANIGGTNIITDVKSFAIGAKSTDGAKVHPTQKPVALISKFIEDSTAPGAVILDTFGGSGTTAVAAIRTGRRFILMEQDEGYYLTACRRIENERRASEPG